MEALLSPLGIGLALVWSFAVLASVQLTVRLIMAFSLRATLFAAVVQTVLALAIAFVYDVLVGPQPSLATRLAFAPIPMVVSGLAGFGVARWVLRFRRVRGQVVAGLMVGVLDPHLFALLWS